MQENETYFLSTLDGKTSITAYLLKDFLEATVEFSKKKDFIIDYDTAAKIGSAYTITMIKVKPAKKTIKKKS